MKMMLASQQQKGIFLNSQRLSHRRVFYGLIEKRHLPLIGTEEEIVFAQTENSDMRASWFYSKSNADFR